MTLRPRDLPIGTWLRWKTSPEGRQIASCGVKGLAVHLNAKLYVTGRVYALTDPSRIVSASVVCFKPDGWPLPDGVHSAGHNVPAKDVEIISEETHQTEPCTITDRLCKPLSENVIKKMVKKYMEKNYVP